VLTDCTQECDARILYGQAVYRGDAVLELRVGVLVGGTEPAVVWSSALL